MKARLFQRHEPGVGHREGRGALARMVKPVPVLGRPVLVEPMGRFDRRRRRQRRRQQLRQRRHDLPDLVGEFGDRHDRRDGQGHQPNRGLENLAQRAGRGRVCRLRQPRVDALGQPPVHEQRPDLGHAEIASGALALAHDIQQDRPFAVHQQPVVPAPVALGAFEIRIHVGRDFAAGQPALDPAARIGAVLAEPGEPSNLVLMHLRVRVQDAGADAMLVERTIAQRVEHGSGPPAAQQPQRIEAVGDQRDRISLQADQRFLQPGLAAGGLDGFAKL